MPSIPLPSEAGPGSEVLQTWVARRPIPDTLEPVPKHVQVCPCTASLPVVSASRESMRLSHCCNWILRKGKRQAPRAAGKGLLGMDYVDIGNCCRSSVSHMASSDPSEMYRDSRGLLLAWDLTIQAWPAPWAFGGVDCVGSSYFGPADAAAPVDAPNLSLCDSLPILVASDLASWAHHTSRGDPLPRSWPSLILITV